MWVLKDGRWGRRAGVLSTQEPNWGRIKRGAVPRGAQRVAGPSFLDRISLGCVRLLPRRFDVTKSLSYVRLCGRPR
jgi:hypothetical protein